MKKFEIEKMDEGWRIWDSGRGIFVIDDNGRFRYGKTCWDAIVILQNHLRLFCSVCDEKLRKSEGDGPCSDCMDKQCKEKNKATAAA